MKLDVIRANPAGNITLFVLTSVEKELRAKIAEKLLAIPELAAEQVGYRCEPDPGYDGRMEMAGGEFCGNASRAYGMLIAKERGIEETEETVQLTLQVSGSDTPVEIEADMEAGTSRAKMPLPQMVCRRTAGGVSGILVHLGGIAHFVVDDVIPSETFFEQAEKEIFSEMSGLDAYGVMFYDSASGKLIPLVKVPAANSLYWEGSCGSGSLATVIAQTEGAPDWKYAMDLVQPAGTVRAEVERVGGRVTEAYIGGDVEFDPPMQIEVDV